MIYVEKGFTLKGVTVGDIIDGSMVVGLEEIIAEDNYLDIALIRDYKTIRMSMEMCYDDENTIYGLDGYQGSNNIDWVNSLDIANGIYTIEKYSNNL